MTLHLSVVLGHCGLLESIIEGLHSPKLILLQPGAGLEMLPPSDHGVLSAIGLHVAQAGSLSAGLVVSVGAQKVSQAGCSGVRTMSSLFETILLNGDNEKDGCCYGCA